MVVNVNIRVFRVEIYVVERNARLVGRHGLFFLACCLLTLGFLLLDLHMAEIRSSNFN
jgi:hypothetical protein